MKKKFILGLLVVIIVAAGLGIIKFLQIRTIIAGASEMAPPPETVATTVVRTEKWRETLPAIGSVNAAQGVMVAPEIAGKVSEIAFESGATVNKGDLLVKLDTSSEEA
ncbi:MAG TPA: biotin/lipoyl-binding protein, partial [Candidatus Binatia bacterium]|nr:biotin/lipoyl-binding protein [Candidatus Binatia bacterium]